MKYRIVKRGDGFYCTQLKKSFFWFPTSMYAHGTRKAAEDALRLFANNREERKQEKKDRRKIVEIIPFVRK